MIMDCFTYLSRYTILRVGVVQDAHGYRNCMVNFKQKVCSILAKYLKMLLIYKLHMSILKGNRDLSVHHSGKLCQRKEANKSCQHHDGVVRDIRFSVVRDTLKF